MYPVSIVEFGESTPNAVLVPCALTMLGKGEANAGVLANVLALAPNLKGAGALDESKENAGVAENAGTGVGFILPN